MPILGEDALIMQHRARLENFWLTQIAPGDQAAWLAAWEISQPQDSRGRIYRATPRTSLTETVRPPQTVYAWSQMFAVYRFKLAPLYRPAPPIPANIAWTVTAATPSEIMLRSTVISSTGSLQPNLFYACQCRPGETDPRPYRYEFATQLQGTGDGQNWNFISPLSAIGTVQSGDVWKIKAFSVDNNNMLKPPAEVITLTVA